jgi:hypothetical protein
VPARDIWVTVGRGSASQLKDHGHGEGAGDCPIKTGQTLGELTVSDGKDVVARVPLVAQTAVAEGGCVDAQWSMGSHSG